MTEFVVLDGGLATELGSYGHKIYADPLFSSRLILSHPEECKKAHKSFLEAGSDVITTNTYQINTDHLCTVLRIQEKEAKEIIRAAVRHAIESRDEFWSSKENRVGRKRPLIAGSCGAYGACLCDVSEYTGSYIGRVTKEDMKNWHRPRVAILLDAGVDLLAFETIPAAEEGNAILELMQEFPNGKYMISFSCKSDGETCHGESILDALKPHSSSPQTVAFGMNCTAPGDIEACLQKLQPIRGVKPFLVNANSGEEFTSEKEYYSDVPLANVVTYMPKWVELGATWIGGCCRVFSHDIKNIRIELNKCLK